MKRFLQFDWDVVAGIAAAVADGTLSNGHPDVLLGPFRLTDETKRSFADAISVRRRTGATGPLAECVRRLVREAIETPLMR